MKEKLANEKEVAVVKAPSFLQILLDQTYLEFIKLIKQKGGALFDQLAASDKIALLSFSVKYLADFSKEILEDFDSGLQIQKKDCAALKSLSSTSSKAKVLCESKSDYVDALIKFSTDLKAFFEEIDSKDMTKILWNSLNKRIASESLTKKVDEAELKADENNEKASYQEDPEKINNFLLQLEKLGPSKIKTIILPLFSAKPDSPQFIERLFSNLFYIYLEKGGDKKISELIKKEIKFNNLFNHSPVTRLTKGLHDPLEIININPLQTKVAEGIIEKLYEIVNVKKTAVLYLKSAIKKLTLNNFKKAMPSLFLANLALNVIKNAVIQRTMFAAIEKHLTAIIEKTKWAMRNFIYPILGVGIESVMEELAYNYLRRPGKAHAAEVDAFSYYFLQYRQIAPAINSQGKTIQYLFQDLLAKEQESHTDNPEHSAEIIDAFKSKFNKLLEVEAIKKDFIEESNIFLTNLINDYEANEHDPENNFLYFYAVNHLLHPESKNKIENQERSILQDELKVIQKISNQIQFLELASKLKIPKNLLTVATEESTKSSAGFFSKIATLVLDKFRGKSHTFVTDKLKKHINMLESQFGHFAQLELEEGVANEELKGMMRTIRSISTDIKEQVQLIKESLKQAQGGFNLASMSMYEKQLKIFEKFRQDMNEVLASVDKLKTLRVTDSSVMNPLIKDQKHEDLLNSSDSDFGDRASLSTINSLNDLNEIIEREEDNLSILSDETNEDFEKVENNASLGSSSGVVSGASELDQNVDFLPSEKLVEDNKAQAGSKQVSSFQKIKAPTFFNISSQAQNKLKDKLPVHSSLNDSTEDFEKVGNLSTKSNLGHESLKDEMDWDLNANPSDELTEDDKILERQKRISASEESKAPRFFSSNNEIQSSQTQKKLAEKSSVPSPSNHSLSKKT